MQRIEGMVQHYDWGDHEFLPRLLGIEPDGRPWAELWLGTHSAAPTMFDDGTPLADITGELPFLMKVLACARPLSLQTHPNSEQARDGYGRGVFSDPHAKPELLCALTPFEAFCGIRPIDQTLSLVRELGADELARVLAADGTVAAFTGLLRGAIDLDATISGCSESARPEARWVETLRDLHPGDPSVAATLLLNHVTLEPGDALRLDAGNLHAYLRGAGIEVMGPSDNVVRAGLTSKVVDVDLLLEIVDTAPMATPVLPSSGCYALPAAGVELLRRGPGEHHLAAGHELAVDLLGATWHLGPGDTMVTGEVTYVVRATN